MRKIFTLFLTIIFAGGLWGQAPDLPAVLNGTGTSGDPLLINSEADLKEVAAYFNETTHGSTAYYHFKQTATFVLTPEWTPIGGMDTEINPDQGKRFYGYYDGNGKTISGLTISMGSSNNIGLFGRIGAGTAGEPVVIKNLHLREVGSIEGNSGTGSLVGRVTGSVHTMIEGCSVVGPGPISGTRVTGGLVGANNSQQETPGGEDNPVISKSYADIPVEARDGSPKPTGDKIGGLVGCNQKGTTVDSYAWGTVTVVGPDGPFERVGGLAGCADLRGRITTSYSSGSVTVTGNTTLAGGLVGNLGSGAAPNRGTVTSAYYLETAYSTSAAGTPLSDADMKQQASFSGFDFVDVWTIEESVSYPTLNHIIQETTYLSWVGGAVANENAWGETSNWSPARLPQVSDIVVIPSGLAHYPVITEIISVPSHTVNIQNGASLTIAPSGKLTIEGNLNNALGAFSGLVIQSSDQETGSLTHTTDVVDGTIQRFITGAPIPADPSVNPATIYHLVSVPLNAEPDPLSGLFLGSYLYQFDAVNQAWAAMGSATTTILDVDQGYMIYYPNDAGTTYSFEGSMNSGPFEIPVSHNTTTEYTGFNLVPNPYPSALDWDAVSGWNKTNLNNSIWIWNPQEGQYASYASGTGTLGGSKYIPVGQSFFVQANAADPVLSVDNGARVHNDQPFFKKLKGQTEELLRVRALANNYSDEIVVRFLEEATPQHDSRFDAVKMYGSAEAPQLYSQASDGQKLSIYSHPHPTENITIPLGFELEEGETARFEFEGMDSFDAEMQLLLEDLLEDVVIDLRTESAYSFAHEPGFDTDRFVLHMQVNSTTGTDPLPEEIPFQIFAANRHIHLSVPSLAGQTAEVEVFDLLGRRQQHHQVVLGAEVVLGTGSFDGVAIVRVVAGQQVFTQRVIIQ